MNSNFGGILTINLVCSTAVFYSAARIYVLPKVGTARPESILLPILILHSLRHLGLMFLAEGATYPGMPGPFAYPAATGDIIAAVLAFVAIPVTLRDFRAARPLLWAFNILGTVDLATAIALSTTHGAAPYMGAAYWIPAFWVPSLLVTHYVVFVLLLKRPADSTTPI